METIKSTMHDENPIYLRNGRWVYLLRNFTEEKSHIDPKPPNPRVKARPAKGNL
jgi:hypothetical protein